MIKWWARTLRKCKVIRVKVCWEGGVCSILSYIHTFLCCRPVPRFRWNCLGGGYGKYWSTVIDVMCKQGQMINWNSGFCFPGICSVMSFPSWWIDWMKNCSYGVNVLLSSLSKVIILSIMLCSCQFWRMCSANADCGLLFWCILSALGTGALDSSLFDQHMKLYKYCRLMYRFHFCRKLSCYYGFWFLWVVKWYYCIWRQSSH